MTQFPSRECSILYHESDLSPISGKGLNHTSLGSFKKLSVDKGFGGAESRNSCLRSGKKFILAALTKRVSGRRLTIPFKQELSFTQSAISISLR